MKSTWSLFVVSLLFFVVGLVLVGAFPSRIEKRLDSLEAGAVVLSQRVEVLTEETTRLKPLVRPQAPERVARVVEKNDYKLGYPTEIGKVEFLAYPDMYTVTVLYINSPAYTLTVEPESGKLLNVVVSYETYKKVRLGQEYTLPHPVYVMTADDVDVYVEAVK